MTTDGRAADTSADDYVDTYVIKVVVRGPLGRAMDAINWELEARTLQRALEAAGLHVESAELSDE